MKSYQDVNEYLSDFPEEIQEKLKTVRAMIREVAPDAIEGISYGMPAYKLNKKPLVYFAAQKNHLGFYATPNAHEAFKKELAPYKQGKGSVQFPYNQELPLELMRQMVEFNAMKLSQ